MREPNSHERGTVSVGEHLGRGVPMGAGLIFAGGRIWTLGEGSMDFVRGSTAHDPSVVTVSIKRFDPQQAQFVYAQVDLMVVA